MVVQDEAMEQLKKYAILIICIFNVLLHLTSILYLEYHRDELLYFSLSNHLEFGYASVDLFTCGESVDPWISYQYLKEAFEAGHGSAVELKRGEMALLTRKDFDVKHLNSSPADVNR